MSDREREIFISYAWGGDRETIVNQVDDALQSRGIKITRDKRDLGYRGSIQEFMERIGRGQCVIVVISDKYLRSPNCMFELVELADNKQFHDRIFPIVLADADIYDPVKRLEYVKFWERKRAELAEAMKTVDPANLQGIRDDMDNYDRFRDKISGLTSLLKDMNTLTPEMHSDSNFEALFSAIERRLSQIDPPAGGSMPNYESSAPKDSNQKGANFFNQSGQTVHGNQTNVVGDYQDNRVITTGAFVEGAQNVQEPAVLAIMFEELNQELEKMEAGFQRDIAEKTVQELKVETEKGDKADENKVQTMLMLLLGVAPGAWEIAVAALINPIAGISTVFQNVAMRARSEKSKK